MVSEILSQSEHKYTMGARRCVIVSNIFQTPRLTQLAIVILLNLMLTIHAFKVDARYFSNFYTTYTSGIKDKKLRVGPEKKTKKEIARL